jgi:hypothetical protein
MPVMEAVWPITALYFGPLAVWGYHRFGRPASTPWLREHGGHHPPDEPRWAGIAVGAGHCAAGCTLGDVISAAAKADILSLTVLPESAPDADQPGVLVPHAARHDRRLLHLLAGQRVADPPRHQGGTSRARAVMPPAVRQLARGIGARVRRYVIRMEANLVKR